MQNFVHWGASLENSQIQKFEQELKETLEGLEPCTQSEAQFSLMPIVKRCAKGQSVILVECQNEMKKDKVEKDKNWEEDKKVEQEVDRFMHAVSERTEKKRSQEQQNPPKAFRSPFQESFDESARKLAEEKGLVPGVLVFWKGNLQRAWRVESIRCDRGCPKAMVGDPEPGPVTEHREYPISDFVLAELSDPVIENVPAEGPVVEEMPQE